MRFIALLIITIWLSGCATITRSPNDKMAVSTVPSQAVVTTDKETSESKRRRKKSPDVKPVYYGCAATPCEFKMPRRSEFIMTISKDGYEDVEIGIDNGISKKSLNANLAGSAGTGAVVGITSGAFVASFAGALGSGGAAGLGAGAGATAAAVTALPLFAASTIVDVSSGALLNLRPNPITITLPPEGTKFEPHPKVQLIRDKRASKGSPSKEFLKYERICRNKRLKKRANGENTDQDDEACARLRIEQ